MSERVLFDHYGQIKRTFKVDEMAGRVVIRNTQDVEPILNDNKRRQTSGNHNIGDWARHVAHVPNNILVMWMREDGVNYYAMGKQERGRWLRRKLYDPANRHLLTSPNKA